jgi:hypothetical protein
VSAVWDAFATAFLVGLEGAIAGALGWTLLRSSALRRSAAPFAIAVGAGLVAGLGAASWLRARGLAAADVAPALRKVEHLYGLALAALALLARGRTADELAGRGAAGTAGSPAGDVATRAGGGARRAARGAVETVALAAGLLVLLPEGAFLASRLEDLAVLRGTAAPIAGAAALGVAAAAALGVAGGWAWARAGAGRFLTPAAVLSLLLALELAGIAAVAVDAHSLPAAFTAVASRGVHDGLHLVFVVLQVPDHAFLEDWAYQLILRFLEPAVHAAIAALLVSAPIAAAWRAFHARPAPALPPAARAPERRLSRARFLRARRLGGVPYAAAVALSVLALGAASAGGEDLYDPLPEPVVDDGAGRIRVPLGDPLKGAETRMRKWAYAAAGRAITFFTIRRPDGSVAAALDVCDICQPKGYAQMGAGYVFCKYCKTPIPAQTVGQPGGCNPIPIPDAVVEGGTLVVPRAGLVGAWERRMGGPR